MEIDIEKTDLAYLIEYAEAGIIPKRDDKTDGCGEEAMRFILSDLKAEIEHRKEE